MVNHNKKGKRRESEASKIYEQAGYETYRPQESKWGETDMFGLFDMIAVPGTDDNNKRVLRENAPVRFVQVKSNRASGIEAWCTEVAERFRGPCVADFVVCHDREGWRLLSPTLKRNEDGTVAHETLIDERELDCEMGSVLVNYLENARPVGKPMP